MIYSTYPTYQKTNVIGLNLIPSHWELWKVTHGIKTIGSGTTPKSENFEYYDGDSLWVNTSELREKTIVDTEKKLTELAFEDYTGLKFYNIGAVIIAMYGATIGRLGILGKEATVNQACCVFDDFIKFNNRYLFYWFWMMRPTIISLSYGGGQPNLSQDLLKQLRVSTPPIDEQQSITQFLDYKTAQIDTLIEKKEQLLKLLEEKRIALITNAVTGHIPSLREGTEGWASSGISWLGNIPQYWKTKRLKFSVNLINEKVNTEEVELPYMGLENIDSWNGNKIETTEYSPEGIANVFRNGDVLFGKLRPYLAKVYLAQEKGCCTSEAIVLRSNEVVLPIFLQYYLLSEMFIEIVNSSTFGSKMPRASWEFIGSLALLLPPLPEQKLIVEYLNKELLKIDQLSEKVTTAIEKLKEYRTSLITSAVTGKIDLRNWQSNN